MPRLVFINIQGEELKLIYGYGDLGDAAGDLDGGDALNELKNIHGEKAKHIREIRIISDNDEPLLTLNTDQ